MTKMYADRFLARPPGEGLIFSGKDCVFGKAPDKCAISQKPAVGRALRARCLGQGIS